MNIVKIKDKTFKTFIPEEKILESIKVIADRINEDMKDKNPLFMAVLNGSFIFAADLMRMITIPCQISFVKLASYQGTTSTGKITEVFGVNEDLSGRTIVIVEDIVDICTLLLKPDKLQVDLDIEYAAMEIPNDFIVGYGLDYDQEGRGLRDIYTIVE